MRARLRALGALIAMAMLAPATTWAGPDEISEAAIADYVQIEVETRMLTNASLQQRRQLESGDDNDAAASREISRNSSDAIIRVYADFGTTASAHMAFGTRNAKAIARWLDANPQWQRMLEQLSSEFDSLLASFGQDAVR